MTPAELTATADGWRLAPTQFRFAGGSASLAGLFGTRTEIDAQLQAMPLSVLDIGYPELGLGGIASGNVRYRSPSAGAPPTGDANLRIRGLTRAGLVLSSRPVDIGLNARLDGINFAMRAIAVSEGRTIGRMQARISPIGTAGSLAERLSRAPMRAQLRYNGACRHLVAADRDRIARPLRPRGDRRRHERHDRFADQRLGAHPGRAAGKRGHRDGDHELESVGRFGARSSGSPSSAARPRRRNRRRFGLARFRRGERRRPERRLHAESARLLDRDDIQAAVTGDLASVGRRRRRYFRRRPPRLRPFPARQRDRRGAGGAAQRARDQPDRRLFEPDPPRRALAARPRSHRAQPDDRHRTRNQQRMARQPPRRRDRDRAQHHRRRHPAARHLRFRRTAFRPHPGQYPLRRRTPVNPQLDIAAEARVRGLAAQIRVSGRSQRPEIAFTSTPALPQDQLLLPNPVRHVDHQPVGSGSRPARLGDRQPQRPARRPRPDQRAPPLDRPRSPASFPPT